MNRDIFSAMKAKKAAVQYGHPSRMLQLIIVAGPVEKTTTARILAELLRESGKRVAVFTKLGSAIEDVPYVPAYAQSPPAIQQAISAARKQRCDVVVMEVDGVLAKAHVLSTLYIDLAVVTGEGEGVQQLLGQSLKYAVLPSGFDASNLLVAPHQLISVGEDESAEAQISDIKLYRKGTELVVTIDHQTVIELATYLVGQANAVSAAYAAAAGYVLGVSVDTIPEGVARLEMLPGNYQILDLDTPYQLVVDRSTDERSLQQLIASAKQLTKRRLIVISDTSVDARVIETIKPDVDRLIGVTGHSQVLTDEAGSLEEAVSIGLRAAKKDDIVLMVGRDFAAVANDGIVRAQEIVEAHRGE